MRYLSLLLLGGSVASAAPHSLAHQGRVLDAAGGPINGEHQIELAIVDGGQAVLASESFSLNLDDGYYAVVLGAEQPLPDAVFASSERWVRVSVDGVAQGTLSPLTSVPFAVSAEQATGDLRPSSLTIGATSVQPSGAIEVAGSEVVSASGALPHHGQRCAEGTTLAGFAADGALICESIATVPSGLIAFFAGGCPEGFAVYAPLQGRAVVGLPSGGNIARTVGTPLSDGGLRVITDVPAHQHSVDPPNTASSNTGAHAHSVDPAPVNTSTTGSHRHTAYAPRNDSNSSGSQGYPANDNHQSFRSSDRARERSLPTVALSAEGNHAHSVDVGATTSNTTGAHAHNVDIAAFSSGSTGSASVDVTMPYVQLTPCRAQ